MYTKNENNISNPRIIRNIVDTKLERSMYNVYTYVHRSITANRRRTEHSYRSIHRRATDVQVYEYIRDMFSRIFSYEWTSNRKYNNHFQRCVHFRKKCSLREQLSIDLYP